MGGAHLPPTPPRLIPNHLVVGEHLLDGGDDAWDVLVLVGIILAAMGFFAEFWGSRLNRSQRAGSGIAEIDERNRRFDESARANALRLNTYTLAPLGCTAATNATAGSGRVVKVISFPASSRDFRPRRVLAMLGDGI